MANIFRVVKDKNYTIVNNDYLKNKNLRVDSIGLLTIILSLPSDFNITMKGIINLTHQKANYRAIKVMLDNLKENGYLEITKLRDEKGHFFFDYIFFESNKLNPIYNFYIVDDANQSVINDNKTNSPPPTNPPLVVNDNIKVFDEVSDIGFVKKCISDYSVILVDYIELLEINKDELLELKELVKNENKTLIIISCCSVNKELMNNDHYNELKEIADLVILTDR